MNATADERLVVMLEARISEFEKRMRQAEGRGTRTYQGLRRNSRTATRAMEQDMVRSTGRINQALASTSARIGGFGRAFVGGLAAGAATAAIGAVTTSLRQTVGAIAAVGDEARRSGLGVEEFQQWGFVAEQNRIPIDALADGFKELNLRADEWIVTGAGPAAEAFQRLGFTADDLAQRLEDPSELMLEIIRRMEGLDRAAQIRVADEAFGGSAGERFVELLGQGERGLRRTLDRAREVGAVMDEEMIQRAAELDRQFAALTTTVGNFGKGVAVAFAQALAEALRLRADIDDAFRNPGQAGALAGEDVAEALREDGRAALEAEGAAGRLRQEYERLGDQADGLQAQLNGAVIQLRAFGYGDAATEVANAAEEMGLLVGQLQDGTVTGEEFQTQLDDILTSATEAFGALEDGDKVEFTLVTSALSGLSRILEQTRGRAAATVDELREIAGLSTEMGMTTGTPLTSFFLPPTSEAPTTSIRPNPAPRNIDFGLPPLDTSGGGAQEGYAAAVTQIRERTQALELEAASLVAAAAGGREYGDAIEYARQRAALMLEAQREGREITPELQAEIDALAEAYVTAGDSAEQAAERIQQVQEASERGIDAATDVFMAFGQGADEGRAAVARLILEIARMQAMRAFQGLAGGSGGGFFSFLGGMLGGGKFDQGGYTGDGGTLEPKGVVHGGEYVFSKKATQAIGVARLERMHQNAKGYAAGGYVGAGSTGQAIGTQVLVENYGSEKAKARVESGPDGRELVRVIVGEEMARGKFDGPMGRYAARPQGIKR